MNCIYGKKPRDFCGKDDCLYHFEKSFASFQGMCCGASNQEECEDNRCNCGMLKIDCWDKEKNGNTNLNIVSKGSSNHYYFICPECNFSWNPVLNKISSSTDSRWCPECGKKKTKTWTHEYYIKVIMLIHGKTYGYDKTKYVKMSEDIIVTCYKHGDFNISATSHKNGRGCIRCGIEKTAQSKRYTFEEVQSIGTILHSGKYTYLRIVSEEGKTIVLIKCPEHDEFQQDVTSHLKGKGCIRCARESTGRKNRKLFEEYKEEANIMHNNYYNYISIYYENQVAIMVIKCPIHGLFEQIAMSHLSGKGCSSCGLNKRRLSRRLTNKLCIQRCHDRHGDLYDYSLVEYKGCYEKIQIICKKHDSFWMKPCHHFKGYGCYSCNRRSSKPAREWLSFIQSGLTSIVQTNDSSLGEFRVPSTRYSCDGYDTTTNSIYEFQGSYWHGDTYVYTPDEHNEITGTTMGELYQKTLEKKKRCIELGYKYIEIWESQWNRFKKIIRNFQKRWRQNRHFKC
jgi:hypothetical protein